MLAARIEICAHVAAGLVSFFHFLPGDFQMKLVSFDDYRIGIVHDDSVVDVSDVTGAASAQWPPVAMNHLIANFPTLKSKLGSALTRNGVPLAEYVTRIVEEAANSYVPEPDIIDHLRAIGVIGAVDGKKRADGRSWSEIEAACDPN